MAGSQFTKYMTPVLVVLRELGGSARPTEVYRKVAETLNLSDNVLSEQKKSGGSVYENRVAWARFYLAKTGYIDSSKHGVWALTEKGRNAAPFTDAVIGKILKDVQSKLTDPNTSDSKKGRDDEDTDNTSPLTSEAKYRGELLHIIMSLPPSGFERLCQRLLRESGFEEVTVTGRTGDGGIDGIGVLKINSFVSFKVLFQCKRYKGSVPVSALRDFRGAMMGRADKGIMLTTGAFTADTQREAVRDGVPPIELVDGEGLAKLFEDLELGLIQRVTYDIDTGFFDDFR